MIIATSVDPNFMPGCRALIGSIRQYQPNAKIVVTTYDMGKKKRSELEEKGVYVYPAEREGDARRHGKAWATYNGMSVATALHDNELLHIDSDAWLLSSIGSAFNDISRPDGILAFMDAKPGAIDQNTIRELFGQKYKPIPFNAGIVFYKIGDLARQLISEFVWSVHNEGRQTKCGNQPIIRILAEKYRQTGLSVTLSEDSRHWNPVWKQAERLKKKGKKWINLETGKQQRIFHAAGGAHRKKGRNKPWQEPGKWSKSALQAFSWVHEKY